MRKNIFFLFTVAFCFLTYNVYTNKNGPTSDVAGNPPLNETCAASGCHTGSALNSGGGTTTIICKDSLNAVVTSYIPNHTYTVDLSVAEGIKTRYGFEATVMKGSAGSAAKLGTLSIAASDINKTQLFGGCVLHKQAGIDFTGSTGSWSFLWKAPTANFGTATIYAAFNASNKDGEVGGDKIYTKSLALTGTGTLVGLNESVNNTAPKLYPNPATAHVEFQLTGTSQIVIYSMQGQLVKTLASSNASAIIDISDLIPGTYIAHVKTGSEAHSYKFIKQ